MRKWLSQLAIVFLFINNVTVYAQDYKAEDINEKTVSPVVKKSLADRLYDLCNNKLLWIKEDGYPNDMFLVLSAFADTCEYAGLNKKDIAYLNLEEALLAVKKNSLLSTLDAANRDHALTNAAIDFLLSLYNGGDITQWLSSDQISGKYRAKDEETILNKLAHATDGIALNAVINSLQPVDRKYKSLRLELKSQIDNGAFEKVKQLQYTTAFYRWMHHFQFNKMIVVNINAAMLNYYQNGEVVLDMKVVVGKPSTKTPRFAAYCNEVILYPYWNVPASIATKELFPKFRRSPGSVNSMDMQVIDRNGNAVDPYSINWSAYTAASFPYRFRQSTGCDNALGVIKFNLTSPYSVYLHDTNFKGAFKATSRYLSHGCIRLEKPIELGNYLLLGGLDTNFLSACVKDQKPVNMKIETPVPVFVLYIPVNIDEDGVVQYLRDIYNILPM